MSETLFIRFTPASAAVQWLLVDHQGGRLATVLEGPLADAVALALTRRVVVLIPGSAVLLSEPELPVKSAARLQQMVPFALEEQLACDVDAMHFALGKRSIAGKTLVAAITHEHMQHWRALLGAVGLSPDAIYAESVLIPSTPAGVTVVVDRGVLYVRGDSVCGTSLDAQPLAETLTLVLPADSETAVTLYVAQDEYSEIEVTLEACRERYPNLQIKLLPEGPLPLFALQATRESSAAVNLLQGTYAQRSSFKSHVAPWRAAAVLLLVAVFLHLTFNGVQLWRLKSAEQQVNQQLSETLMQTLPDAASKDANNARKTFESRLAALQTGGDAGGLLPGLDILGAALAQIPDTHIEALAYRNKILDLRLSAPTVDALDRLRSLAQSRGVQAELQSATPREKNVEGRLQLKPPGA
ncbi:MAG: type II secretion system protein GspL [Candidatus Obscuribacterales bacterium]|nr:type II secretion system protein GspL [Steroidobacteraceae bacterium]